MTSAENLRYYLANNMLTPSEQIKIIKEYGDHRFYEGLRRGDESRASVEKRIKDCKIKMIKIRDERAEEEFMNVIYNYIDSYGQRNKD